MYRITKSIHFCYAHRLLGYEGLCTRLHGHNGRVEIELLGEALDPRGMVFEFGQLGDLVKDWIDKTLDHRTLLREDDPLVRRLQELGEPVYLMKQNPTAEAIAEAIYCYVKEQGLPVYEVRFWETDTSCAAFRG